jgi:hypothetical protein
VQRFLVNRASERQRTARVVAVPWLHQQRVVEQLLCRLQSRVPCSAVHGATDREGTLDPYNPRSFLVGTEAQPICSVSQSPPNIEQ